MPRVASISTIPFQADRVAVLVNPHAGPTPAPEMADRLLKLLPRRGFVAEGFTELAAAATWANQCHAEGRLRALVGIGGDGTAAELMNRTAEGVPLTLLPAGNSNLLARHFGLRNDPDFVCRTIAEGVLARFDAGRANGRLFSLMAGCGFDAEVVRRVHQGRRGHLRQTAYFGSALQAIASYPFPEIRVHWEEEHGGGEPLSARWLFAFNLPCYGGGFRIAPESDGSDGLLDVLRIRPGPFVAHIEVGCRGAAGPAPTSGRLDLAPRPPLAVDLRRPGALPARRRPGRPAPARPRSFARPSDAGGAQRCGGGEKKDEG